MSDAKSLWRFSVAAVVTLVVVATCPTTVGATPCKDDGELCRTNQSCCGRVCVNSQPPGKRPKSQCCTPTTCTAAGAECGLIDNGSCPNMLNCGDCPAGQVCTGNICETPTTTTTTSTTTTTLCTPDCGGRDCGGDGCGGSCGECPGQCIFGDCFVDCITICANGDAATFPCARCSGCAERCDDFCGAEGCTNAQCEPPDHDCD